MPHTYTTNKENYLDQAIFDCPTEQGIKFLSGLNFRSTKSRVEKIKDGETVD